MTTLDIVLEVFLLILGAFIVVAVLLQKSKSQGLSGAIQGGAETFYGKGMGSKKEKILSIATAVASVLFIVLAIVVYAKQATFSESSTSTNAWEQLVDIVGK